MYTEHRGQKTENKKNMRNQITVGLVVTRPLIYLLSINHLHFLLSVGVLASEG